MARVRRTLQRPRPVSGTTAGLFSRRYLLGQVLSEACEGLVHALDGPVTLDHVVARLGGREHRTHVEARLAAFVREHPRDMEAHGLEATVLLLPGTTVLVHQPFGFHDLDEGDLVLVVAPVGTVHDEAPDAARLHFHLVGRGGEAVWAPPLADVLRLGPHLPHQLARRIEDAHPANLAIADKRDVPIFPGHASPRRSGRRGARGFRSSPGSGRGRARPAAWSAARSASSCRPRRRTSRW